MVLAAVVNQAPHDWQLQQQQQQHHPHSHQQAEVQQYSLAHKADAVACHSTQQGSNKDGTLSSGIDKQELLAAVVQLGLHLTILHCCTSWQLHLKM